MQNTDSLLAKYKVLYRGRRVIIFDAKDDEDFGYGSEMILWDKKFDMEIGWANRQPDGSLLGRVAYGPNELTIRGADFRELARHGLKTYAWSLEH